MRGYGGTREKRQNQIRALKQSTAKGFERSAAKNYKHRSAYKNVTLAPINMPPERT